jgi:pre-mRNA-processing factor 6
MIHLPSTFGKAPPDYVAGRGRGASAFSRDFEEEEGPISESLADDESGLFVGSEYDADDAEADAIWDAIDERMDSRRRKRREALEAQQVQQMRKERPKISAQLADLKADLKNVTYEEWQSIQEPGEYVRSKRQKIDRYTPTPSSLLEQVQKESQYNTTLDIRGFDTPGVSTPGYATSGYGTSTVVNVCFFK